MSLKLVSILVSISIQTIISTQFIQSAHLKPSSSSTVSGITVNTGIGATVTNDQWSINVITQQGSDLSIAMDSRWGFHPFFISSIQFYIEGHTTNQTYQNDGEILFIFNVNDEYFAEMISIDERKSSYKECPASNDPLITRDVTEMMISATPDRYHRFCKNSVNTPRNTATDNWNNVGPSSYKHAANWPMWITITNDPILNTISYQWTDAINGLHKVSSQYTSSFQTNHGLNVYISGESPNEDFYIFSIDIIYRYDIITPNPTPFPTLHPSIHPTLNPTKRPTSNPTSSPTQSPTPIPTQSPTVYPSVSPTVSPTRSPTVFGETRSPTRSPTHHPTLNISWNIWNMSMPPIVITEIININPTKIVFVSEGPEGAISWFQAMIIIVAVFVFIVLWVGFCGFVFFVKRKSKSKNRIKRVKRKPSNSNSNRGEEDVICGRMVMSKDGTVYKSESAMIADKSVHERIPDFLNIKMPPDMFESSHSVSKHEQNEYKPITPDMKAMNRRVIPCHVRSMDDSETDMGHSETDDLSRHDMIYIPGKQTKYREKYRASILRQQSDKQYKRYKVSIQSIDI